MKGLLLGGVTLIAFVTAGGSSLAADLRAKPAAYKAVPAIAPGYNWTGFYIGLNAGYSWGETDIEYGQDFPAGGFLEPFGIPGCGPGCPFGFDLSPASAIGGAQVGYNWQAAGSSAVIGIEADIAWRNGEDSVVHAINPFDVLTLTTRQRRLGTVRGGLGWADCPWMIYATGGVAFGNVKHEVVQCDDCGVAGTSIRRSRREDQDRLGGGCRRRVRLHSELVAWGRIPVRRLGFDHCVRSARNHRCDLLRDQCQL